MEEKSKILHYIYEAGGATLSNIKKDLYLKRKATEEVLSECLAEKTLVKDGDIYKFVGNEDLLLRRYRVDDQLRSHEFMDWYKVAIAAEYKRHVYETTTEEGRKEAKERTERTLKRFVEAVSKEKEPDEKSAHPSERKEEEEEEKEEGPDSVGWIRQIDGDLSRRIFKAAQDGVLLGEEDGFYYLEVPGLKIDGTNMKFDLLAGKNIYLSDCGALSLALKRSGITEGRMRLLNDIAEEGGVLCFDDHLCIEVPSADAVLASMFRLFFVVQYNLFRSCEPSEV